MFSTQIRKGSQRLLKIFPIVVSYGDYRPCIDRLVFNFLGSEDSIILMEPFSKEKVLVVLVGLRGKTNPLD